MALDKDQILQIQFEELEYLCEETFIDIIPAFRLDKIELISCSVGPFRPPFKTSVPIWLAIILKNKKRCTIVLPDWFTVDGLTTCIEMEKKEERFTKVNQHYIELSKILIESFSMDIPQLPKIRTLLKDLKDIRSSKIRAGLEFLNPSHLQMDQLTSFEINQCKPIFKQGFDQLLKLNGLQKITPHHRFFLNYQQQSSQQTDSSLIPLRDVSSLGLDQLDIQSQE